MAKDIGELYTGSVSKGKKRAFLIDLLIRLVKEKPLGTIGGIIVVALLVVGSFANLLAPYGVNENHLFDTLSPPSTQHLLGTDQLGRDLLTRIIYGARISMFVGLATSAISVTISSAIGMLCGFLGGKFDLLVQRLVDAWMCFPALFIILAIMSIVGPGVIQIIIVLGILFGVGNSRVVRSVVIDIKENVYIQAAKVIGCPTLMTIFKHILPNVMSTLLIIFTLNMGAAIITEASISFLGFGIPPPTPSWGGMLSGDGRKYMLSAPWMALWPGLALAIVVWGINMFGDGVRDILDPRLRGGLGRYSGVRKKMTKQLARSK